jgi:starvation-inducible outer membrane lipoprotein
MKTKTLTVISLAAAFAVSAVILAGCKGKPESFGQAISDKTITPIRAIVMKPADYSDKTITIEGKIILECPAGGWFDLQQDAALLHVDLHPTGFAIPQKVGSIVTVQGTLKIQESGPVLIGSGVEIK